MPDFVCFQDDTHLFSLFFVLQLDHNGVFSGQHGRRQCVRTQTIPVLKTGAPWCWISQVLACDNGYNRKHQTSDNTTSHIYIASTYTCTWMHVMLSWMFNGRMFHCSTRTLTPPWTRQTYRMTRRGIRIKCKQPSVSQSEVTFTRRHLICTLFIKVRIDTIAYPPQGRGPEISGILSGIISKCWLCARVSLALLRWHRRTQVEMAMNLHADTNTRWNAPTRFDLIILIFSGRLLCSAHLHVAEFLCRWSRILATIQSTA